VLDVVKDDSEAKPKKTRPDLPMPYVAPTTATERILAEIWSEQLNVDKVGVHDGFLELGGDSLLAARVVARVRQAVVADLSASRLLEATTVCIMGELIDNQVLNMAPSSQLDVLLGEIEALSDEEASCRLDH
jgi:hypothetical protein